jgi:hypothetical protein
MTWKKQPTRSVQAVSPAYSVARTQCLVCDESHVVAHILPETAVLAGIPKEICKGSRLPYGMCEMVPEAREGGTRLTKGQGGV